MPFDHRWRWRTMADPHRPPGHRIPHPFAARFGDPCRVLARGRMNSVLVEFEDGMRAVCSRNAVRLA